MLPVFTEMVDDMLESSQEQLSNLKLVVDRPHVLDDVTLGRIFKLYTEQLEDQWLFEQQFTRWKKESLDSGALQEVNRLALQAVRLKETNEKILALAKEIAPGTIDKILSMDDLELGMAVLTGQIKPPL